MAAQHRAESAEDRLIEDGHVDPENAESWTAAFERMHELERIEQDDLGLPYARSFPWVFGTTMCSEHNDEGGDHCAWNDPEELFMALYDLISTNPQTGKRRAHHPETVIG